MENSRHWKGLALKYLVVISIVAVLGYYAWNNLSFTSECYTNGDNMAACVYARCTKEYSNISDDTSAFWKCQEAYCPVCDRPGECVPLDVGKGDTCALEKCKNKGVVPCPNDSKMACSTPGMKEEEYTKMYQCINTSCVYCPHN